MQKWREEIVLWLSSTGFDDLRLVILAGLAILVVIAILSLLRSLLLLILRAFHQTSYHDYFDFWYSFVKRLRFPTIFTLALAIGSLCLPLSPFAGRLFDTILLIIFAFLSISLIQATIFDFATYIANYFPSRGGKEIDKTAITFFKVIVSIVLWLIAIIVILRSWNYDITVLLSGLGVASVVISFSAQNFLKDIFAFFTIYSDKAFAVGDYIISGDYEGTVREIRLRTTRLVAPSGENLIIANNILVGEVLANFANLSPRRVTLDFYCLTTTPPDKIEAVVADIKKLFDPNDELAKIGFVHLRDLQELAFQIKLVYYYHDSNFVAYLDHREKINLATIRIFRTHGVKFTNRAELLLTNEDARSKK